MSSQGIATAMSMLRERAHRTLYEGCDGYFYVDYSDGQSPKLSHSEVETMLKEKLIQRKWPSCQYFYVPFQS